MIRVGDLQLPRADVRPEEAGGSSIAEAGRSDALAMCRRRRSLTDIKPKLGLLDDSSGGRLSRLLSDAHAGGLGQL